MNAKVIAELEPLETSPEVEELQETIRCLKLDNGLLIQDVEKLESENASLQKQIDQLTDDLARAREGDL